MLAELIRLPKKSDSESGGIALEEKSRGFEKLQLMTRGLGKKPLLVCNKLCALARAQLSIADPRQLWKDMDFAKKHRVTFGKMKGRWRMFTLRGKILVESPKEEREAAGQKKAKKGTNYPQR